MSKLAIIALDEGGQTCGTVCNIIEIASDTALGITLPLDQLSWDCGQYPVAIGDRWEDGVFSRDGQPVTPVPTDAQRIAELESEKTLLAAQVAALSEQNDFQEELIVELANVVYA